MIKYKLVKVVSKNLLSSNKWPYFVFRLIVSWFLMRLSAMLRPINSTASIILNIYGCIFAFEPEGLAAKINLNFSKIDHHLVIASRAFFEIAFARGELPRICNFLIKITTYYPYLFEPWKLLHYSYYHLKSWESLLTVNTSYEQFRSGALKSIGMHGYDVIFGDHVTASIGHSQIFFDFQILNSRSPSIHPKIAIYHSNRDRMSGFYRELMPDLISDTISIELGPKQRPDLVNFIQDSFPFLVTEKYFDYLGEGGRAKYLASWAASGSQPFMLTASQKDELSFFLQEVGLTENDWYVVLHVREGADNSIRNADISSYYLAIDAIISNGGWVVRIGDSSMTQLHKGMQRVIDLPFTTIDRPKYIDLYLLATARFVICTCSGPSDFPFYFNTPRLVTNWHCMSTLFGSSNDICLPVSYYCSLRDAIITLEEQLTSVEYHNEAKFLALKTISATNNSSNQIRRATVDMIQLTAQNYSRTYFPGPLADSLSDKYGDKFWFMGSISKAFLEDYPNYLD